MTDDNEYGHHDDPNQSGIHEGPINPDGGRQRPETQGTDDAAAKQKDSRRKVGMAILAVAALVLIFGISNYRAKKSKEAAKPTGEQTFTKTGKEQRQNQVSFSFPAAGQQAATGQMAPGAAGQEDPRILEVMRQIKLLQAATSLKQAQFQYEQLRLPTVGQNERALSVTLGDKAAGTGQTQSAGLISTANAASHGQDAMGGMNGVPKEEAIKDDTLHGPGLRQGTMLDAVLVNKLITDNYTSPVLAMIDHPYYDPLTRKMLIPAGTRVIGKAEAVKFQTASRLAVTFNLFQLPNGRSFFVQQDEQALEGMGVFGLEDKVNRHTARILFTAGLIGILTGWNNAQIQPTGNSAYSGTDQMRYQASQSMLNTGERILSPFLNAMPTITVNEGHRLKIWISRNIPLEYYEVGDAE